jgi:hypothetical protein
VTIKAAFIFVSLGPSWFVIQSSGLVPFISFPWGVKDARFFIDIVKNTLSVVLDTYPEG